MSIYIPFIHKIKRNKKNQPQQVPLHIEKPFIEPPTEHAEEKKPIVIELF